ncbi:hypothetical protein K440DRAFT_244119 [Wilcoxina mikolae CBS 423.85]|nr:hypothetical protein K440DRAFT_244119 [Wilcoxina mikolae CBS 423.85]
MAQDTSIIWLYANIKELLILLETAVVHTLILQRMQRCLGYNFRIELPHNTIENNDTFEYYNDHKANTRYCNTIQNKRTIHQTLKYYVATTINTEETPEIRQYYHLSSFRQRLFSIFNPCTKRRCWVRLSFREKPLYFRSHVSTSQKNNAGLASSCSGCFVCTCLSSTITRSPQ